MATSTSDTCLRVKKRGPEWNTGNLEGFDEEQRVLY
jgi:hypothetical protein